MVKNLLLAVATFLIISGLAHDNHDHDHHDHHDDHKHEGNHVVDALRH